MCGYGFVGQITEVTKKTTGAPHAGRRKRRKEINAQEIATLPIEEFTQEQSTKGSYSSYIQPYIQFAIDNGWTSNLCPECSAAFSLENMSSKMI